VTYALCAAGALALLAIAWAVSLPLRDASIVDPVWGLGFAVVGWIAFAVGDGGSARRLLLAVLVSVWGLRLFAHLARRRLRERVEDHRYTALRKRSSNFALRSLLTIFLFQGALIWVISLPVQAGSGSIGALAIVGTVIWAVGELFEAVGDAQLARFAAEPGSRGKVMDRGLWRYTRHPNYFGDFLVWWGLFLVGGAVAWTVIGPLVISYLLIAGTGKKLLESDIGERRPGYAEYVRRTSGFVPLPPRG
jgi:steroid 5-alpha reductase family enzyme